MIEKMQAPIVHIGYPKAASTYLQNYLMGHPGVSFSHVRLDPLASVSIDDVQSPSNFELSPGRVRFLTNEKIAESLILTGNSLIWHQNKFVPGMWDDVARHVRIDPAETARRIKKGFGAGKALIVIRDQVEWLQSAYKYFLPNLPGRKRSFKDFCETPCGRVYLEAGHYDRTIEAYLAVFDRANLKVMHVKELRDDSVRFASNLCAFLGIDYRMLPDVRSNEGSSNLATQMRVDFPIVDRLPPTLRRLGAVIIASLLPEKKTVLSDEEINELSARYAQSNKRTGLLLQKLEQPSASSVV